MSDISKEQAQEELNRRAKNVSENDVKKILEKRDEIENKFKGSGVLGKFVADVKILFSMIHNFIGLVITGKSHGRPLLRQ